MSLLKYKQLKQIGIARAWELAEMPTWITRQALRATVLTILLGFISLVNVYLNAEDALANAGPEMAILKDKLFVAERNLAACLNGSTFKVNKNDALKCGYVIYEKGN